MEQEPSFIDFREVPKGGNRIRQETQCNPAKHEMEFGTVIRICGRCRFTDDPIGGFGIAEIDQPASEYATLAPPFIRILMLQIPAGAFSE